MNFFFFDYYINCKYVGILKNPITVNYILRKRTKDKSPAYKTSTQRTQLWI